MELAEYTLESLRNDQEFILYRGRHRNRTDIPSVLLLVPVSTRPALESSKRIRHEYSLTAELGSAWAVRSIALNQYNGRQVVVLEDPGGEPLKRLIQGLMEMIRFLRFAIGLASAINQGTPGKSPSRHSRARTDNF